MKIKTLLLTAMLTIVFVANAQTTFYKVYDTISRNSVNNGGNSVQQTTDGGYIITGAIEGAQGVEHPFFLMKTKASGDTLWTKTYGGNSVQQTFDGGYIITGTIPHSEANQYSSKCLIKTNTKGDSLWTKTYGRGVGYSVKQTRDSGYVITGVYGDSVCLIKTNTKGDLLWTKTYGRGVGGSVQQTIDGGFVITGMKDVTVRDTNVQSVYLMKTNAKGDLLWTKTYGDGSGRSVQQTTDSGYIITGYQRDGYYHFFLIKTNASGDTLWTKTYGRGQGGSVQQTTDGGYIITGCTGDGIVFATSFDLIKTNASGKLLWDRAYCEGYGASVQQTTDGGYVITGFLYKFIDDAWPGESPDKSTLVLIKTNSYGEFYPATNSNDIWTKSNKINIYPNPTTGSIFLSEKGNVALSDLSGKLLLEQKNTKQMDISSLPAGMYFLRFGENKQHTFKVIKE